MRPAPKTPTARRRAGKASPAARAAIHTAAPPLGRWRLRSGSSSRTGSPASAGSDPPSRKPAGPPARGREPSQKRSAPNGGSPKKRRYSLSTKLVAAEAGQNPTRVYPWPFSSASSRSRCACEVAPASSAMRNSSAMRCGTGRCCVHDAAHFPQRRHGEGSRFRQQRKAVHKPAQHGKARKLRRVCDAVELGRLGEQLLVIRRIHSGHRQAERAGVPAVAAAGAQPGGGQTRPAPRADGAPLPPGRGSSRKRRALPAPSRGGRRSPRART